MQSAIAGEIFAGFLINSTDFHQLNARERLMVELNLNADADVLELERFDVLPQDGIRVVDGISGLESSQNPEVALFRGGLRGDARSRAFLSVSPSGTYGFVRRDSDEYIISSGPPGSNGATLIFNPRLVPQELMPFQPFECAADLLPNIPLPAHAGQAQRGIDFTCRTIDLAIETDQEFLGLFGGNTSAAGAYIATLVGAVSEIYQRDTTARFRVVWSRLWTGTDPWDQGNTSDQLQQFRSYWNSNMTGVSRHAVHMLSGRNLGGGIAYLSALCASGFDYGLSANLDGFFPYPIQNNHPLNWDLMVVAHELGHNCGAPHTHSMSPPVDCCGGGYSPNNCGNVQDCAAADANIGTIMSYCHICPGGMTNMRMEFHSRTIFETILPYFAAAEGSCGLAPEAPAISDQPDSLTTAVGASVQFSVTAENGWPLTYQWRKGGVAITNGGPISGATTATLTISPVAFGHAGVYDVVVTPVCGPATTSNSATLGVCPPQTVLYVDDSATGANSGLSWPNAFVRLQDALSLASVCTNITEIWVAEGTYRPDETNANPNGTGDRNATFQMRNGLSIIGGFRGLSGDEGANNGATRPLDGITERPTLQSILNGDLAGDDGPNFANYGENSYHVVNASGTDASTVLDGFTVEHGNAGLIHDPDGTIGGGLFIKSGTPIILNCVFRLNDATTTANEGSGGAIGVGSVDPQYPIGNPSFTNCLMQSNSGANTAGAAYIRATSSISFVDCELTNNAPRGPAAIAGGAFAHEGGSGISQFTRCRFLQNSAPAGGAIWLGSCAANFVQCEFIGNNADTVGGAIWILSNASATIVDSTFDSNTSQLNEGGAVEVADSSTAEFLRCNFLNNRALALGGGACNIESSSTAHFTDCTLTGNIAAVSGGAIQCANGFAELTRCVLGSNSAQGGFDEGGGAINARESLSRLLATNCRFLGNSTAGDGGAIRTELGSLLDLRNCAFSGNLAGRNGGALNMNQNVPNSVSNVVNCTMTLNTAANQHGGAIHVGGGELNIRNSILWGNLSDPARTVYISGGSPPTFATITHCDVQGIAGPNAPSVGPSVINANPLFLDADGPDNLAGTIDDDPRLMATSPCIDSANNLEVAPDTADLDADANTSEPTPLDLAFGGNPSNPRFLEASCVSNTGVPGNGYTQVVDMGAYEFVEPDCDNDGIGDACDSNDFIEITAQPQSQTVCAGEPVALGVNAAGAPPITYQWRRNSIALTEGGAFGGTQQNVLLVNPASSAVAGSYDVVITGTCGSVTSNAAILTVTVISGDINQSGEVDIADLTGLLSNFGALSGASFANGDLDGDGDVDLGDLTGLLSAFGSVCF